MKKIALTIHALREKMRGLAEGGHDMSVWKSIANALGFGGGRKVPPFPAAELADGCGLAFESEALASLERRLASAFRLPFMEHVRGRVMAAKPVLTDDDYDWALFELRRFFLMTAICKEQVPMYSGTADAIWHEMLLFTREYESFCRSIAGRFINHEPHAEKPSRSGAYKKRVRFELIYGALFRLYPMNDRMLGAFRKHYFSAEELAELERMDAETIRKQWFREEEEASRDAALKISKAVQAGAEEARRRGPRTKDGTARSSDYAAWLITASIWEGESRKGAGDGNSGYYGGSADRNDGDSGSSGGDSGSSGDGGGSSCGGGCGGN